MALIVWDEATKRLYETGVDHGVLYPMDPDDGTYPLGVAWNGLTGVTEKPSGGAASPQYADNTKYLNLMALEEFGASIEAFTYPKEFEVCDGSAEAADGLNLGQQSRLPFGFVYRTLMGNDAEGTDYGYKLHLVYGCQAAPSERAYATVNDSPSAINFSWEVTSTPVPVTDFKPTSVVVVDSTLVSAELLTALENILFGTEQGDPRLPLPNEVIALLEGDAPDALTVDETPVDNSSGAAITVNVVLTFNNPIVKESVVMTSAAGAIVAVVKSWDANTEILTLNPEASLANSTTYIVTIAGVVDIYGQALAAAVVNFETVGA